jgi:hypothetical protein
MARLTAQQRRNLPASTFAGPGRSFPIPDEGHARAALLDVGHAKGLSADEKANIRARARAKLGGRRSKTALGKIR